MEKKVLTEEEISKLKDIQQQRNNLLENFGLIELRLQENQYQKQQLIEKLNSLRQIEIQIGQELNIKYGEGTINLSKGEFISS